MRKKKFSFGGGFPDLSRGSKIPPSRKKLDPVAASGWLDGVILEAPISKKKLGEAINTHFSPWRLVPLYLLASFIFIIIIARLFSLQVIEGSTFLSRSNSNGIRIKTIHAPRGVIYDRNGEVLARNIPAFRVAWDLTRTPPDKKETVKNTLASILKISKEEIEAKLAAYQKDKDQGKARDDTLTIKANVDRDTTLILETKETELPGVISEISPVREYLYKEVTAHLLGYTGEISREELSGEDYKGYSGGDIVGKDGVEKEFEKKLKGQDGQELVKVDSSGKKLGALYTSGSKTGQNLYLSIDIRLQQQAYEALKSALEATHAPGGSMVVTDPNTGEILAMVSYPAYDNNLFAQGISAADYSKLMNDTRTPLLNRVIGAAYPPGSTFKIITSASGLETGSLTPDTKFEDTGTVSLGPITFANWLWISSGRKEGQVDVVKALQRSNDTFFYLAGQKIGEKPIQEWAGKFGLGTTLGVNLPGEITGLVPTDAWKQKVMGEPWYPGNTLNMAIGQGDLLVTPLQVNDMTAVVANGGKLLRPTILKTTKAEVIREGFMKKSTVDLIREGLKKVPVSGGTAWPFFDFKLSTAGKTGTAESGGTAKPHAWYTAFATPDNPQMVATVMMEKAGEGSNVAAPVLKKVWGWWFFEKDGKKVPVASVSGEKLGD